MENNIAQSAIACWIEDCFPKPNLNYEQLDLLLHHVEVGIMRVREDYE